MSMADRVGEFLEQDLPARPRKILEMADEYGWTHNPHHSFVIRLTHPDHELARPFFMRWDLVYNEDKEAWSWRFQGARANNGQALNFNDVQQYLQDPAVIWPEPPEGESDDDQAGPG